MNPAVMVVDDDSSLRMTINAILSSNGFSVTVAEGGKQCLEELHKGFKGLILMDVMMPEMDGWTTTREIVKQGLIEGNVISMLTAVHNPEPEMEEFTEYIINYIRKPFQLEDLVASVRECCSYLECPDAH